MPGPATHTTPSDPVRIELELSGESIDLQTVSTVATRLIDLLGDLERGITGKRKAKARWVIGEESTLSAYATPNGTSAETLQAVVRNARSVFLETNVRDLARSDWSVPISPAGRTAVKGMIDPLEKNVREIKLISAPDEEPATLARPTAKQTKAPQAYHEYASVDGFVEMVSVTGYAHFKVREHHTENRIRCALNDAIFNDVKAALRQRAIIEGIVHCRGDGTPFSMTKISSIFVRQRPKRTMSELLGAARGLTGGMSSEDYVNSARDGKHG